MLYRFLITLGFLVNSVSNLKRKCTPIMRSKRSHLITFPLAKISRFHSENLCRFLPKLKHKRNAQEVIISFFFFFLFFSHSENSLVENDRFRFLWQFLKQMCMLAGGAERLAVDAAVELSALGHHVHIFTAHHDKKRCFEETIDGAVLLFLDL